MIQAALRGVRAVPVLRSQPPVLQGRSHFHLERAPSVSAVTFPQLTFTAPPYEEPDDRRKGTVVTPVLEY